MRGDTDTDLVGETGAGGDGGHSETVAVPGL